MGTTQGIADTCIPSMAETVSQSPSSTSGDQPPDEGITVSSMVFEYPVIRSDCVRQRQEFSSSTPTNALLPSNPQVSTISAPDITSGTAIPSAMARRANDNGQDLNPTILTELTHPPN
jgi:hypothetical protein